MSNHSLTPTRHRELCIVVPTLNEAGNIALVVAALDQSLKGINWEVIFVDDDSKDATREQVRKIAESDDRIRLIHRIGRRGLSSACIEGMLATTAQYIAVTDADLQHDIRVMVPMLQGLRSEPIDVAIGSRYMSGGTADSFSSKRLLVSQLATRMARVLVKSDITDPMSGFFMLRREVFEDTARHLSGIGFKILLDILASSKDGLRVKEYPYQFGTRQHGESKLDSRVITEYLALLLDKFSGGLISMRFLKFSMIGASGLIVHLAVLAALFEPRWVSFITAQILATGVAMVYNFILDNRFAYRDMRLRGWRFVTGLISFMAVCSIGAIANIDIAAMLYHQTETFWNRWWISGIAGAMISLVWNYAVTSVLTWQQRPKH
ncbi:MAG: glycosyltransferase family 2 protein [Candidatus Pacebacteria bacterium]|nr:glycosyltransferase family 2 protein [Candidatus Paceibacterota bacterium]